MAEDNEDIGILAKLALMADATQNLFNGRSTIIFELDEMEFRRTQVMLKQPNLKDDKFKIDMSGSEFIFLINGLRMETSLTDDTTSS